MTRFPQTSDAKAAQPPSPSSSLDYTQHNCNKPDRRVLRPKRRGCGAHTLFRPKNGQYQHLRSRCKSYRCGLCGPCKLRQVRKRIVALAVEHDLTRFLTLTLDAAKLDPTWDLRAQLKYLHTCWRKMRVYIQRKLGKSLKFIAVVELQQNGRPHLHLLIGSFLAQAWISEAWSNLGGGPIADIRRVKINRVAAYLAKYLTDKDLCDYPTKVRRFSTSRGLPLFAKEPSEWQYCRASIEILRRRCPNVESEKRDESGAIVEFTAAEPPPDLYSRPYVSTPVTNCSETKFISRTGRKIVASSVRFSPHTKSLEFHPTRVAPDVDCEDRRSNTADSSWRKE